MKQNPSNQRQRDKKIIHSMQKKKRGKHFSKLQEAVVANDFTVV